MNAADEARAFGDRARTERCIHQPGDVDPVACDVCAFVNVIPTEDVQRARPPSPPVTYYGASTLHPHERVR